MNYIALDAPFIFFGTKAKQAEIEQPIIKGTDLCNMLIDIIDQVGKFCDKMELLEPNTAHQVISSAADVLKQTVVDKYTKEVVNSLKSKKVFVE